MAVMRINPALMQRNYNFMRSIATRINLMPRLLEDSAHKKPRSAPSCGPVTISKDSSARKRMRAMARFG